METVNSSLSNGGYCREEDTVLSLAHCSWASVQGSGKRAACMQLYTGWFGWANTNLPFCFLGFLVNLGQLLSTLLASNLNPCLFPFSALHKWKTNAKGKLIPETKIKVVWLLGEVKYFEVGRHHSTWLHGLCGACAAASPQPRGVPVLLLQLAHTKPNTGDQITCTARWSLDPDHKCRLSTGLSCAFS